MKHWLAFLVLCTSAASASTYSFLPDRALTPGAVASINPVEVCEPGYPAKMRHVTPALKRKVYRLYQVDPAACASGCKIDHLVPLSIGGANDRLNLWPHEYGAQWNVFQKTRLEVRLRKEVCSGKLNIQAAQQCISNNWTECYQRFYAR